MIAKEREHIIYGWKAQVESESLIPTSLDREWSQSAEGISKSNTYTTG